MRALLVEQLGPVGTHRVHDDVPAPAPGPGEALIEVEAAGVNFPDLLIVQGLYQFKPELPFAPGGEGAGTVLAVGADVRSFAPGDEVTFIEPFGAFQEQVVVRAERLVRKPPFMSFEEAAAFTLTYGTSYYALKQRARLQPGESLLVLGAAGGVGSAAVELGAAMGAEVIAAASTEDKRQFAESLGAGATIDYVNDDLKTRVRELTGGRGADVVYDPVGGEHTEAAFRAIAWNGRHLVVGFSSGTIPRLPLNLALLKHASLVGVFWGAWTEHDPKDHAANMEELYQMVHSGTIRPRIEAVLPLERHDEAFALLADRKVKGKVVLKIAD